MRQCGIYPTNQIWWPLSGNEIGPFFNGPLRSMSYFREMVFFHCIDFPLRKLYQIVITNGYTRNWLPLNVFLRPPGDLLCFERYCPLAVGCLSLRAALGLLRWSLFVGLAKYRDVGLGVPAQLAVLHPAGGIHKPSCLIGEQLSLWV